MIVLATRCNKCGVIKGEGNRWLKATRSNNNGAPCLVLSVTGDMDICGSTCLQKIIAEYIAELRQHEAKLEAIDKRQAIQAKVTASDEGDNNDE